MGIRDHAKWAPCHVVRDRFAVDREGLQIRTTAVDPLNMQTWKADKG
jgi:hypothetical protein